MSNKPLEITKVAPRDNLAQFISHTWLRYNSQRQPKIDQWKELRNYIFATDTRSTSNSKLPWKNSTTLPKLCQIRDNLHSNYISALFPNDNWLKWEAYSKKDAEKQKTEAIEAYMSNKTRENFFRMEVSKLVYDYIDYGNAFATVEYEASYMFNSLNEKVPDYIGPRIKRISPLDIVFNPIASSFADSFKIVRSLKNIGELKMMGQDQPDNAYLINALEQRDKVKRHAAAYGIEESDKSEALLVDGFGNYSEYLQSEYVEILEFFGDLHDSETGVLERAQHVVIIDRMWVILKEPIKTWLGHVPIYHVGRRL